MSQRIRKCQSQISKKPLLPPQYNMAPFYNDSSQTAIKFKQTPFRYDYNHSDLITSKLYSGFVHPDLVMTTYGKVMTTCYIFILSFQLRMVGETFLNISKIRSRPPWPPWLTTTYPDPYMGIVDIYGDVPTYMDVPNTHGLFLALFLSFGWSPFFNYGI